MFSRCHQGNDHIHKDVFRLACYGCVLFGVAFFLVTSGAFAQNKPNIVFILADDLGFGELGCYGQQLIETPELDKMATEGKRFTQFYAGSTVCAPSRCVLMTGLHTGHSYYRANSVLALPDAEVTVAEVLKQRGYTTALIGKWGLGEEGTSGHLNRQGFDYFLVTSIRDMHITTIRL